MHDLYPSLQIDGSFRYIVIGAYTFLHEMLRLFSSPFDKAKLCNSRGFNPSIRKVTVEPEVNVK